MKMIFSICKSLTDCFSINDWTLVLHLVSRYTDEKSSEGKEIQNMSQEERVVKDIYPYEVLFKGMKVIFLWKTTDKGDVFELNEDCTLAIYLNQKDVESKLSPKMAKKLNWEQAATMNFNLFFDAIIQLKPFKPISTKNCKILLEGWNFLEDLVRTFELASTIELLSGDTLDKVYKKLFYGNNLDAVTPMGKSYNPALDTNECLLVTRNLNHVWSEMSGRVFKPME